MRAAFHLLVQFLKILCKYFIPNYIIQLDTKTYRNTDILKILTERQNFFMRAFFYLLVQFLKILCNYYT